MSNVLTWVKSRLEHRGDSEHGQALIRVGLDGANATKADQWDMGQRIRDVAQGPDGSIWLVEDTPGGRLLQLTPP